ncbi:MAG TPA: hypothetical protein VEV38_02175 [Candidatus Eremiobacteraceae bacterium]|nr:hypothetical protein [Candidatus Eremiobacteraceae bacterium]
MRRPHLSLISAFGLAALLVGFVGRAFGADATPAPSPSPTPVSPTRDQILTFVEAMDYELTPDAGKIVVNVVDASKMPSYDPLTHYLGMAGGKTPTVEAAGHPSASDDDIKESIARAFALAVMDDGEAGPYWKDLYDKAAAKDAALPSSAPDPYRYRHELADVAEAIMANAPPQQ